MLSALSGRTILLTGASGFIGSRVLDRLSAVPGARLVAHLRRPLPRPAAPSLLQVTDPIASLDAAAWKRRGVERIDLVVHLAGFVLKGPATGPTYPAIYESSLLATRALLEGLPGSPDRVVFASTLDVYSPPLRSGRITESSPLDPRTLYAASKLFLELVLREHAEVHGYTASVLRLGHVYGPGEKAFHRLIPVSIGRMLRGEPALLTGDPSVERDFLYVDDAAEAILRSLVASPVPATVNVVRGESVRVQDVLDSLAAIIGNGARVERRASKATGHSLRFDASGMRAKLGAWPLVPFEEGLRREVESMRALPS